MTRWIGPIADLPVVTLTLDKTEDSAGILLAVIVPGALRVDPGRARTGAKTAIRLDKTDGRTDQGTTRNVVSPLEPWRVLRALYLYTRGLI